MADIDHKTPKSVDPDNQETQEMEREYNQAKKSIELQEIEAAAERCHDVHWWKKRLDLTGWAMYFIGFIIWVVPDPDNERGLIVLLMAFLLLIFNSFVNTYRLRKRRMILQNLVNSFKRKNAMPFYHDLLEKFADQPNLHIHLAEDGTIVINDRKNKEIK